MEDGRFGGAGYEGEKFARTIPVADWVRVIRRLLRSRPLRVSVDYIGPARHPWHTRAEWDREERRWTLDVWPGYVLHRETLIRMAADTAPGLTRERLGEAASGSRLIDAWLSESPRIPVAESDWRMIASPGDEAGAGIALAVPEYFRALGAGRDRELRSVELVLSQPRESMGMRLSRDDEGASLHPLVRAARGREPRLSVRREFRAEYDFLGVEALVAGQTDDGIDELNIATIYALAPVGIIAGGTVDERWEISVKHRVFRNLCHAVDRDFDAIREDHVTYPGIGLAGGAGDALIMGQIMADQERREQANALADRSRIRGYFWTI